MSRRNPIGNEKLTTIPRRSPRFLSSNSPEAFDPKTPKGKLEANRILHSGSTPLSSTSKSNGSNHDSAKSVKDEVSRKSNGGNSLSINPVQLKRSARFSKIKNQQKEVPNGIGSERFRVSQRVGKMVDSCGIVSSKTRVERTLGKSGFGIQDCNLKILKRKVSTASAKAKLGVDLSTEVEGKIEKKVTGRDSHMNDCEHEKSVSNAKFQEHANPASSENSDVAVTANEKTQGVVKLVEETFAIGKKEKYIPRGKEQIGKKWKLNQCKNKNECAKGWTEEQEQALQRAYFAAKPTPQFWKRVAKMVPGKSAQDCFDKIHSAHVTPPQARPRSRAKMINPPSLLFSASKLLKSPVRKSKTLHRSHLAQKTVRQLLQKQCNNDQDEGADLFAIFEATADPSNGASQQPTSCCTPEGNKGGSSFQNRCHETSSADRKLLSRLNMPSGSSLTSPPVLKHIKNTALHEKYIDQLHRRETKRKAAVSRAVKQVASQNNKLGTQDGKVDALNAARNALYFDASDAINQFQQSQMNTMYNCDPSDDDHLQSSDDGED